MEMTIAWMEVMNLQNIVILKGGHVSVICLLVITVIVFLEFTFVMVTMIVWTILMKMNDINAVRFFANN